MKTRRLLMIVSALALMLAMLPGTTAAKQDAKADCKKGGWTEWVRSDGSTFVDQGSCVSYVAEGGTLAVPDPFRTKCLADGGAFTADVPGIYVRGCDWATGMPYGDAGAAFAAYASYCVGETLNVGGLGGSGYVYCFD